MEYEINIERNSSQSKDLEYIGKVWIPRREREKVPTTLFVHEEGKSFHFFTDADEGNYPVLLKKMLEAWNGDRPSSKTDENFTLGDA